MRQLQEINRRAPFGMKIFGTFFAIIAVGAIALYLILNMTLDMNFQEFSKQNSQLHIQGMVSLFKQHYAQHRGWHALEQLRVEVSNVYGSLGDNFILADTSGTVLMASDETLVGQTLAPSVLSQGSSIFFRGQQGQQGRQGPQGQQNQQVGTLLSEATLGRRTNLETDFLSSVDRAILLAGIIAGMVALLLGVLLVRQMTRPLRQLGNAMLSIADGEKQQQIEIRSADALGQIGEAFNKMNHKLDHSEKLRQHFLADITHELRTPLTILQGDLYALQTNVYEPTVETFASLYEESLRMGRLVEDLRNLSLAEAGKLSIEKQPTDFVRLLNQVVETLKPLLKKKNINLVIDLPQELIIDLDPDRTTQVLWNLLKNASHYTPPNGQISIGVTSEVSQVQVEISDTGPGIAADELPYVFDRFWRADKVRGQKSGGTGLGLAIAKQLIVAQDGQIWVQSELKQGTTFVFSLPINHA